MSWERWRWAGSEIGTTTCEALDPRRPARADPQSGSGGAGRIACWLRRAAPDEGSDTGRADAAEVASARMEDEGIEGPGLFFGSLSRTSARFTTVRGATGLTRARKSGATPRRGAPADSHATARRESHGHIDRARVGARTSVSPARCARASGWALPIRFEAAPGRTLQEQLYAGVRCSIVTGRLGPERRLPSTRSLAAELGGSRTIVLFRYRARPLPCLHALAPDGRVIYVGTFPAQRIGFLVVPSDPGTISATCAVCKPCTPSAWTRSAGRSPAAARQCGCARCAPACTRWPS